ncbi:DUF805 domain-containing protein [Mesorhizobium sp. CGMCC 1.15528]|uniref:DUF805 domain-containing protein n=1 Tax=Mesorhizobium zhangyense TaxID=1776730 RepID=A0A7C9VI73_9HYPH|nr:DUF805 domain-containing protein [Mesorhizobium zhangyense]NGN45088.1 DUF805 domain-containing protein [Mesorhizobium zhangyense]
MGRQQFLWVFFGFSGRISRQAFALAGLLLYVIRLYPVYRMVAAEGDEAVISHWASVFVAMFAVLIVSHMALAVKRLHDIDRSGWWSLLFPIGDIIAFILLCIPPGTAGANRYGQRTDSAN